MRVFQGPDKGRAGCWLRCSLEEWCMWASLDKLAPCSLTQLLSLLVLAKRFGVRVHAIAECAVSIPSICASRYEGFAATASGVCTSLCLVGKGSMFCTFTADLSNLGGRSSLKQKETVNRHLLEAAASCCYWRK